MHRIIDEAIPSSDVGEQIPGFAAYVYVTNWALGVVEAAQDMRELWRTLIGSRRRTPSSQQLSDPTKANRTGEPSLEGDPRA